MASIPAMGIFEKGLSIWVGLSILSGILLGQWFPTFFEWVSIQEVAKVNLPIAVLVWIMIFPMMVKIDFRSLRDVGKRPQGLILTVFINWLVKPFTMAFLGYLFFRILFVNLVSEAEATQYIAGMILLGVAPCTAMVFVWSQLTKGDPNYTLAQVAVNDLIMVFLFAPITALLLGVSSISVPWDTLVLSVVLYVVLPLIAGYITRIRLLQTNSLTVFENKVKPLGIAGLLGTVILLFGLQSNALISNPLVMVLIAIPLILQAYGIFFITYFLAKRIGLTHNIAAPASLIGTSNFFELAVAVAISLFGLTSGAALATVVGVLVEVPVMLSLCAFANKTRHWFIATAKTEGEK